MTAALVSAIHASVIEMAIGATPTARGLVVRQVRPAELAACAPLAAEGFGFGAADRLPPWLMHTTNCYGGLTIGAFAPTGLVGYCFALPGFDGRPFLLSCGLVVAATHQALGIGEALKLAQAQEARHRGYHRIRWTTGSLASRPLRLYLKLGARLVRLREGFYGDVRPVPMRDEVEIAWDLDGATARPSERDSRLVEIPWRVDALLRREPAAAQQWLLQVRSEMKALLDDGYVGTAVRLELEARRSFVVFEPGRAGA